MGSREIVTLQIGQYSNFIGTHWWNIQESGFEYGPSETPAEINNDVLFREGLTYKGNVTFTPRLLLVDLNGCLNKTSADDLYIPDEVPNDETAEGAWPSGVVHLDGTEVEQHIQEQSSKTNDVQVPLTENVQVPSWSDYVHTRFHSRTVNVIKEYHQCDENVPFDIFPLGKSLWHLPQFEEDFTDKIRNYIEECDNFQGFQILLDSVNAFSGLSTSCIQYLRDEYASKSILAFPVFPQNSASNTENHSNTKLGIKLINLALCFNSLSENCSLFVPLSTESKEFRHAGPSREFNHTNYDPKQPHHSSAILASALDTFTLKYRLRNSDYSISDLCADLNSYGRKASAASVCLPFSVNRGDTLIDTLDKWEGPLSRCITPNCEIDTNKTMQLYTLRGLPESRLKLPIEKASKQKWMSAYKCNSIQEMLSYYVSCTSYASPTNVTVVQKPLPTKNSFPNIFSSNVDRQGNIDTFPKNAAEVESVPVLSGLHNGKSVGDMLEVLINDVERINFKRFHQYHNEGVDTDEFGECLQQMLTLRECYEDNFEI